MDAAHQTDTTPHSLIRKLIGIRFLDRRQTMLVCEPTLAIWAHLSGDVNVIPAKGLGESRHDRLSQE